MSSSISPNHKFIRKQNVFSAPVEDEIVLLCLERDLYFGLDEIGARVWDILEAPCNLREICETLIREYDVDMNAAEAEVAVLMQDLVENSLILLAD